MTRPHGSVSHRPTSPTGPTWDGVAACARGDAFEELLETAERNMRRTNTAIPPRRHRLAGSTSVQSSIFRPVGKLTHVRVYGPRQRTQDLGSPATTRNRCHEVGSRLNAPADALSSYEVSAPECSRLTTSDDEELSSSLRKSLTAFETSRPKDPSIRGTARWGGPVAASMALDIASSSYGSGVMPLCW